MAGQPSGEKTEKATPKRRREAREKGQIFKSVEIITAFSMLVMFGVLSVFSGTISKNIQEVMYHFFSGRSMPDVVDTESVVSAFNTAIMSFLSIMAPILLAALLCGVVFNVLQVGMKITTKAMAPKMERISFIAGFKRLFSLKTLIEFIKSIIKIAILGIVAYGEYTKYMTEFPSLMGEDPAGAVASFFKMIISAAFKMSIALAIFSPFDFIYKFRKHDKDLIMTKQ